LASDGSVYVADRNLVCAFCPGFTRIQKFTSEGVFVSQWDTEGSTGLFNYPTGVAVASDGSVYVSDAENNRIQKFNSEGVLVSQWGTEGTGDGEFQNPTGVAVASDGSVYVSDTGNRRIQKFTVESIDPIPTPAPTLDGTKIAFTSERDGNPEIYVMNSDGSGQTRLTNNSTSDTYPSLSPNGSKIAFVSNQGGNPGIYVMNSDGSGQICLSEGDDKAPSWSPDGSKITFSSNRDGNYEIYVMNVDGSEQTRLTNNNTMDLRPSWSPDGSQIAFSSDRDGNYDIYVMGTDGSGLARLTDNDMSDTYPSWSPDGSQIAFDSGRDGNLNIYVMNADGSGQTGITENPKADYYPSWSPDGSQLAFSSDRDGNYEIYVMNADGSGQTRLTENGTFDYTTSWSSVGATRITFTSERDGNSEIYIMNADGSEQTRLTNPRSITFPPTPTPAPTLTSVPVGEPTPTPAPTIAPTPVPASSSSCNATLPGAAPVLNSIASSSGYPRQMLAVNGDTTGASVIWDAGVLNGSEITITTGQGGTRYFQVPAAAGPGMHPVALRSAAGTSNIVCVTVQASSGDFPAPRIEDIGLNGRDGSDIAITISAANMDSDARLRINGTEISARYLSSALPVAYLIDRTPATFGYPVYHYALMRGIVSNPAIGSDLNVVITNNDGQSDSKRYTLPARWEDLDSDGDGLLDSWEDGVYTAPNGGTVNLAAMGTAKYKKDILLEADWASASAPGTANYDSGLWPFLASVFESAPVLNPDGSAGVKLIIDYGQGGEFTEGGDVVTPGHTSMGFGGTSGGGYMNYYDYRDDYNGRPGFYNSSRKGLFHYTILANRHVRGAGGQAEFPNGNFSGDDMFCAQPWTSNTSMGECLAHEMGHNIGLAHGGLTPWDKWDHTQGKFNFNSIMNYRYSYGGTPIDCLPYRGTGGPVTFSQGMLNPIVEAAVDENKGICDNVPLDFTDDGLYTVSAIDLVNEYSVGMVENGGGTTGTSRDYDQWGSMILDFRSCWNDTKGLVRRPECGP
jgi:Tol biopolymer transport system component